MSLINILTKTIFAWFFLFFSYKSFRDWMIGKTVFDNINDYDENLRFPSVSLCPREKDSSLNLKLNQLRKDLNLSESNFQDSVQIFSLLASLSNIFKKIEKYSFSKLDVFPLIGRGNIL